VFFIDLVFLVDKNILRNRNNVYIHLKPRKRAKKFSAKLINITSMNKKITITATVSVDPVTAWKVWTTPEDIKQWCFASDDWGVGDVENDVRIDGHFKTHMMAKDGSAGFDFTGVYTTVEPGKKLCYTLDDGRTVEIIFEDQGGKTLVTETFEMENENSEELQRSGWQAILDSYKRHAELT
jgi:uncharacterized protein YndB with AHSA1/START domain